MKLLRTPDERFADLPGFPFEPRYCEVPTGYGDLQLRIHYIDEGPREAPVVVLLHGEPVWSYLWRKLVPEVARAGFRVVALDLPGFGRSDKPAAAELFSLSEVTHWMRMAIVLRLELDRMTCIGQGLGALVGLSLATVHWRALGRVLVIGPPVDLRPPGGAEPGAFSAESYAESLQRESAGQFVQRHTVTELAPEVVRAYDAPFPDSGLRAGLGASMRRGTTAGDPLANQIQEIREALAEGKIEALFVAGDRDEFGAPLAGEAAPATRRTIVQGAGHFPSEDRPEEVSRICLDFLAGSGG